MSLSGIWKSSKWQIILLLVIWFVAGAFLLIYSKTVIQLYLNHFHSDFFDVFFKYWTWLGSGWIALGLIVFILVFVDFRWGILLTIDGVITGIIVQGLKKIIFDDVLRPVAVLKNLHLVQGVDMHYYNSFPSGHTAIAFALFFAIACMLKIKSAKWFFFIVALLIGCSRIYLSQHFLPDVLVGSMIGTIIFLLTLWLFGNKWSKWDMPILVLRKRHET